MSTVFRNTIRTTILLAGLGGLMVAIGSLSGRGGAILGPGLAMVGFSYWKSDALAIRAARAVPADEHRHREFFAVMGEPSAKAQMPLPCLYVSPEPQPNPLEPAITKHHVGCRRGVRHTA